MSTLNLIYKFMTSYAIKMTAHMNRNLLEWTYELVLLLNNQSVARMYVLIFWPARTSLPWLEIHPPFSDIFFFEKKPEMIPVGSDDLK